jgi:hypothetical protein
MTNEGKTVQDQLAARRLVTGEIRLALDEVSRHSRGRTGQEGGGPGPIRVRSEVVGRLRTKFTSERSSAPGGRWTRRRALRVLSATGEARFRSR